jgi:hypothetical protein
MRVVKSTRYAESTPYGNPNPTLTASIALDSPPDKDHAIDAVVRDFQVTTAGYQGTPAPDQWFGGPALSTSAGSLALGDAAGLVVDSLNYGGLVDPWASEGYQATSGSGQSGCRVTSPGSATGFGPAGSGGTPSAGAANRSAGRFPDGLDADSNCTDFLLQPATTLPAGSAAGATNIKVASVADFSPGQTIMLDMGENLETAVIATVGTAGATTLGAATGVGFTVIPVASGAGFGAGQTVTVDTGANHETAVVVSTTAVRGRATITVAAPLTFAHAAGAQVAGSGITLTAALTRAHDSGTQVSSNVPTPGAPNQYSRRGR